MVANVLLGALCPDAQFSSPALEQNKKKGTKKPEEAGRMTTYVVRGES